MSDLQSLKAAFKGDLVTPDDAGFDQAISRWAKNAARRAAVVAFVKDAEDVSAAITYAKQAGLPIAIRGGGHNPSGTSSIEGGLVIDLSRYLDGARIDPEEKLAHVGGGAIWESVDKAAIEHGLATVGGTVNHVRSFAHILLVLGGGYGWLTGAHGLAVDNLATVVTADGAIRTANASTHADLFWGLRGGGSNFGVVTEFVLRLHPQRRTVFAGAAIFPAAALEPLLDATQAWWTRGPSEREGMIQVFTRGPGPGREPCIVCFIFYNGPEDEGREAFKAFFDLKPAVDSCKDIPYEELNALQNHIASPGQNVYFKGAYQPVPYPRALLARAFARVAALSAPPAPRTTIGLLLEYFPLRAAAAVPDGATAHPRGPAPNALCAVYAHEDGEGAMAYARAAARELAGLFVPRGEESVGYGNYSPDDAPADSGAGSASVDRARVLFGSNYPRMQEVKKKYDPEQLFRKWFVITPAA
ncbi:FAD-binding domain-containing protein [Trametes elegans]|nr:FAD-binding domain-containing protein [Trametes elegans]